MNLGAAMTGGNPVKGRKPGDFYPTIDPEVIRVLVREYPRLLEELVWEPMAGDGTMVRQLEASGVDVHAATDIEPQHGAVRQRDFLDRKTPLPYWPTAIVTNPAFSIAAETIEQIEWLWRTKTVRELGFAALFLKATYWHAAGREPLFRRFPPTFVHPLTWRVDFSGEGRPTMETAWFVWELDNTFFGTTFYRPIGKKAQERSVNLPAPLTA